MGNMSLVGTLRRPITLGVCHRPIDLGSRNDMSVLYLKVNFHVQRHT